MDTSASMMIDISRVDINHANVLIYSYLDHWEQSTRITIYSIFWYLLCVLIRSNRQKEKIKYVLSKSYGV